jgi:succinate dehydrogenase/fumarate reductase iron-sulfur protein
MNKITICEKDYKLKEKVDNLLEVLFSVKAIQNNSLTFRSGCRSGVCGSCAVVVNGVEKLACKTTIKSDDVITPLKNSRVIKDLIVDLSNQDKFLVTSKAYLEEKSNLSITIEDEKKIDISTNCVLCNSCFSSCPVYEVNKDFLGPFALARVYRYVNDKKESDIKSKIDTIQVNGIWDCTLCGNCSMVCPAHIDIKNDIMQLRNKSAQLGYNDPNMTISNSGFDTNLDFGFNPNGF